MLFDQLFKYNKGFSNFWSNTLFVMSLKYNFTRNEYDYVKLPQNKRFKSIP